MNFKLSKPLILLVLYFTFLLLIYRQWIFNFNILTYGDWYFFFSESLKTIRESYFYIWVSDFNIGSVVIGMGQAPMWGAYGLLNKLLGFDYNVGLRIVHLYPIIICNSIFIFILCNKIFKHYWPAFIGTLIYCFNTYFLVLHSGHLTLLVAYGIAPIAIYFYIRSLEEKSSVLSIFAGFSLSLAGFYEPRASYQILILLFLYFIFSLFTTFKKVNLIQLLQYCLRGVIPVIVFILLNSYWIIGLTQTGAISRNEIFNRALFGNEFLNIMYAFTLFHPFWTGSEPSIFILQKITFYFWFFPLMAIAGILTNRKNNLLIYFSIVTLFGLLLTKQVGMPFTNLYLWLYSNFPGFNAFREASKFFFFIALGYSVLIAGFVNWLCIEKKNKNSILKIIGTAVPLMIIIITILNVKPLLQDTMNTMFAKREIPSDYHILKDYMLNDNDYSKSLWVPTLSRWNVQDYEHIVLSNVFLLNADWKDFAMSDNATEAEKMTSILTNDFSNRLLDMSSIKYVIIPLRDKYNNDDFFIYYGKTRDFYINKLDSLTYLKRIEIGTDQLIIYRNNDYRPHFYITNQKESIYENNSYKRINYSFVNPTEYKVSIKNIKNSMYLNFSEGFHPHWKIRVGDFNWYDVLSSDNYFLNESIHIENDAHLNSFLINPGQVCAVYTCNYNGDGSYNIDLTVYFYPQSYIYLGRIVSITSLTILLVFIGYRVYEGKRS